MNKPKKYWRFLWCLLFDRVLVKKLWGIRYVNFICDRNLPVGYWEISAISENLNMKNGKVEDSKYIIYSNGA